MESLFNSDIIYEGKSYHIQTEDWGAEKSLIVSRIFVDGAVLRSFKVPYEEVVKSDPTELKSAIQVAMDKQHKRIVDLLKAGQLFFMTA